MEISNLIPHIESLIFASDKPLTSFEITELINQAFGFMEDKIAVEQIDAAIEGMVEKYSAEFYPFEVRQSGGGWQFLTKKEFHKTVAQLNGEKFLKRLSAAALETLAIVAYKQPVTKGEIEAIRGVSSDYAVQKLLEKELIIISGRNEKLPGHPLSYSTSKNFMDYFGINSSEELPKIKEVLADQIVEPTVVHHTDFEQSEALAVSDAGQLVLSDDRANASQETSVNGHPFEEKAYQSDNETFNADVNHGADEMPTESLEDEIAEEEYISDEIFAAEDEIEKEKQIKEGLLTSTTDSHAEKNENESSSDSNANKFNDEKAPDE